MRVNGKSVRTIWYDTALDAVRIIDQTRLPHHFERLTLDSLNAARYAITAMQVRGAPLIGVTAAYGVYFSLRDESSSLELACKTLLAARPTAVNLRWVLERVEQTLAPLAPPERSAAALALANDLAEEDVLACESIGQHGLEILVKAWRDKQAHDSSAKALNILTHCNAGWLATVDWGTALAPIYKAHLAGLPVHVWVDETRPRNQGAFLTAWELQQQGIAHTVIVDNAGGHLMQNGEVDLCIVGSDRTTATGDVCNKIGTYLKALAAFDNGVPFYVALPMSTIDYRLRDGVREIPIEQRDSSEVSHIQGLDANGRLMSVQITTSASPINNAGFDVTPARLVTALITEKGVVKADEQSLQTLREL
jgi:methylthioribose-1-phosphate isomerase